MHKSGEVLISVKNTKRQKLEKELSKNVIKNSKWEWKGVDVVRIPNSDKKYCVECYYLIHVKANRKTEGLIFIPTPGVEIPIETDVMIKDTLLKHQQEQYRIFTDPDAQFEVYVQSGSLNINITNPETNETIFSEVFKPEKKAVVRKFNITKNNEYIYKRYSKVMLEGKESTLFSFGVVSNEDSKKRGDYLKYGIPQYIYIEKEKCVKGQT